MIVGTEQSITISMHKKLQRKNEKKMKWNFAHICAIRRPDPSGFHCLQFVCTHLYKVLFVSTAECVTNGVLSLSARVIESFLNVCILIRRIFVFSFVLFKFHRICDSFFNSFSHVWLSDFIFRHFGIRTLCKRKRRFIRTMILYMLINRRMVSKNFAIHVTNALQTEIHFEIDG